MILTRGRIELRSIVIIAAVLLAFGTSCTTFHYLEPSAPAPDQDVRYVAGYPAISQVVEKGPDHFYGVTVYGYTIAGKLVLDVYYANSTSTPINVLPDQITVIGYDDGGAYELEVHEANEYIRRVQRQQNTALVLQAIAGALDDTDAGYSTSSSYGTYSGSYYGSTYGTYSGSYSGTTSRYDASAAAAQRAQTSAEIRSQAEANSNNIEYLNEVLIKRTTLNPGYYVSGLVYVERKVLDRYLVRVPFGPVEFEFGFDLVELE